MTYAAGGLYIVRVDALPGYYRLNARDGTRVITTCGLLSLRAIARDYYFVEPLFRGEGGPTEEEQASLAAPLLTDGYGRLLVESEDT